MERRIFPEGSDTRGTPYEDMRWSRFKNIEARAIFETISEHVFLFFLGPEFWAAMGLPIRGT
jgi:type I restriction enzyme M protein